jgi:hypothetical protein
MSEMNIFQRMSAVTSELQTVAKNLTVSTGRNNSYKAVSERDIIDAVKPLEAKHGIYSYPYDREVIESQTLESEVVSGNDIIKKSTFFSRIKTVYRFVNIDDPEDYIDTVTFAEGIDSQDKGSGKAMTYGDKYALMKAYKISTGEDPDQNGSVDIHYRNVRAGKATKSPRELLIARLKELGINVNTYAKEHGITAAATDDVYLKHLKELEKA